MAAIPPTLPVLIVGAGPAGLVLALSLLKDGINVRIVDKSERAQVGSRGSGIMPRTLEVLQLLGVLEDMHQLSAPVATMRSYKLPGGTEELDTWRLMEPLEKSPSRPYTTVQELRQELFEATLRRHIERYGGRVEFGKTLTTFEQDHLGVTARLMPTDCHDTTEEVIRAAYLVGADGAHGVVRKILGLTFLGETREAESMIVGDVEVTGLSRDYWHMWGALGSNLVLGLRPCGPEQNRFAIFSTGSHLRDLDLARPENFRELFRRHTGRGDIQLGRFWWLSHFRPQMRMVNKFGDDRVFVVGDAAHVHSPTGGQGLNSSVQDSFNLAWKLAIAIKSHTSSPSDLHNTPSITTSQILSSYTVERLPVIAEMLRQTSSLHTLTYRSGTLNRSHGGWTRGQHLYMLGVNCRWSALVLDERTPRKTSSQDDLDALKACAYIAGDDKLCAGDRAPDSTSLFELGGSGAVTTSTLFAIFSSTRHTVLLFPGTNTGAVSSTDVDVERLLSGPEHLRHLYNVVVILPKSADTDSTRLRALFAPSRTLLDRDGNAYEGYELDSCRPLWFAVRPDGIIGAITYSAAGIERYFNGLLEEYI